MENVVTQTTHFGQPGPRNTRETLEAAAQRANELGLKTVVVASNSGRTIDEALEVFDPGRVQLVAVTHVTGFSEENVQEMPEDKREELQAKGVKVITAAHAFGGVNRGLRSKTETVFVEEIMAHTLRMLGQGVKVGVEIAYMAADRGFLRTDENVVVVGGTGKGADTAMVVRPAYSHKCLELKVREIIAKPWRP